MSTNPSDACSMPKADSALMRIEAMVESSNNQWATRFEPTVYQRITNQGYTPLLTTIQKVNGCSGGTARQIYSTSYGKYQMMGFNLYGLGWQKTTGEFMADTDSQDLFFALFLQDNKINFTWAQMKADQALLDTFSIHYNGSTAYSARVQQVAKELGL